MGKKRFLCRFMKHKWVKVHSETTQPDGVVKVISHCERCGKKRTVYYTHI